MALASRLEKHDLLEFRRLAAHLYKKNSKWDRKLLLTFSSSRRIGGLRASFFCSLHLTIETRQTLQGCYRDSSDFWKQRSCGRTSELLCVSSPFFLVLFETALIIHLPSTAISDRGNATPLLFSFATILFDQMLLNIYHGKPVSTTSPCLVSRSSPSPRSLSIGADSYPPHRSSLRRTPPNRTNGFARQATQGAFNKINAKGRARSFTTDLDGFKSAHVGLQWWVLKRSLFMFSVSFFLEGE